MFTHCPGSLFFQQPIPEPIKCPHCGQEVEIFTNERSMKCYFCGKLVTRERRPSCFDWCRYADKCKDDIDRQRRSFHTSRAFPTRQGQNLGESERARRDSNP